MSVTINLPDIEAGSKYEHIFAWSTKDQAGVITPMDLTGHSAILQIRKKAGDLVVVADWRTTDLVNGGQITLSGNQFMIDIDADDTSTLLFTEYEFGLLAWPTITPADAVLVARGIVSAVAIPVAIPA